MKCWMSGRTLARADAHNANDTTARLALARFELENAAVSHLRIRTQAR
jgi:hypothetical protein